MINIRFLLEEENNIHDKRFECIAVFACIVEHRTSSILRPIIQNSHYEKFPQVNDTKVTQFMFGHALPSTKLKKIGYMSVCFHFRLLDIPYHLGAP